MCIPTARDASLKWKGASVTSKEAVSVRAGTIARVASGIACDVDRSGAFPSAAVAAMRDQSLLGCSLPRELGGEGAGLAQVADAARIIGRACGSSGMIFAMHHSQVIAASRYGGEGLRGRLRALADEQKLVASATTERASGGDIGRSVCSLTAQRGGYRLVKDAPVISYGEQADVIMATARPDASASEQDQVMVWCDRPELTRTSEWRTLGLRGTASHGFTLRCSINAQDVFGSKMSAFAHDMSSIAHVLWSSVWLGWAEVGQEAARQVIRKKQSDIGFLRLAEIGGYVEQIRGLILVALKNAEAEGDGVRSRVSSNLLKVRASRLVVQVLYECLELVGLDGYRTDTQIALERRIRDALGAPVMIGNDRVLRSSGNLMLLDRTGVSGL